MIQLGLEQFAADHKKLLRGRRVGLVTHMAAVAADFTLGLDLLLARGANVTALFGPEHGLDGAGADATAIDDATDVRTGLPVYSLYGKSKEPSPLMLEQVDVLVFDMQDIGARFYTFISTLDYIMQAAERASKEVIVLDRPNPITGAFIEGPLVDDGLESFISHLPVPVRHGYTTGEMARFIHRTKKMTVPLTVIPMEGWTRDMWWDDTGLPWIPLSPGMPRFSSTIPYTGTCLLEGTNISEGRGTTMPFEILGAPWLDGYTLARDLNALALPGVRFRPHVFTPMDAKYHNLRCGGVQVHVTDRNMFRPVAMGVHLLAALRAQDPERFEFLSTSWEGTPPHLDLLMGTPLVREGILNDIAPAEIIAAWTETAKMFRTSRAFDLVYL